MSIIETLTEGIVNRNLQQEGAALLNKWTNTGLLEGLNESQKSTMAVLLENQAKSLLKEASVMQGGDIDGFAAVAFPIVRRVFAGLIANDLVSVQVPTWTTNHTVSLLLLLQLEVRQHPLLILTSHTGMELLLFLTQLLLTDL